MYQSWLMGTPRFPSANTYGLCGWRVVDSGKGARVACVSRGLASMGSRSYWLDDTMVVRLKQARKIALTSSNKVLRGDLT